jgi:mycothiol synthase
MNKHDFRIRNYRPSDFDNYMRLHIETNKLDRSGRNISKKRLTEELGHPCFFPENNLFIAECGDNIIGYAGVFLESGIKRAVLDCLVHPVHRKKGIATELFHHSIRHAKRAGSRVVQICVKEANLAAKHMASRLAFESIRYFLELRLDLNGVQLPDVKPGEYIIRALGHGEEDKLTQVQNRAFADSWGFNPNTRDEIAYRINSSGCSLENILVAFIRNRPVGYCWTRMNVEDNPAPGKFKGNIHMLGVDPDFRRKGIGRNVLLAGLSYLSSNGVTVVELTADGEDPKALTLYESVGFEAYSRSEWYEKKLRSFQ